MKKMNKIFALAAILAAAVACSKNGGETAVPTVKWTVTAGTEVARTALGVDARTVEWTASDKVVIITYNSSTSAYKSIANIAPTSVSGTSAEFSFDVDAGYEPLYISYPSRSTGRYDTGDPSGIRTKVDDPLYLVADNFASGSATVGTVGNSNTSIGVISGSSAVMNNVMAMMMIELTSTDIASITLSGNNDEYVSGFPYFDPSTMTLTGWDKGAKTLTLKPQGGSTFAAGVYYFPLVPQTYSKGITLTFTNSSGINAEKASSASFAPSRNVVYDLGVEGTDWTLSYSSDLVLSFIISNGTKCTGNGYGWPFYGAESDTSYQGTLESATWKKAGLNGPFYLPAYPTYNFYIYVTSLSDSNYFRITGGGGIKLGSAWGDYFQLPAIPGYRLSRIVLQVPNGGINAALTDAVTDLHLDPADDAYATTLAAATVGGTSPVAAAGTNDVPLEVVIAPTGLSANTAYRLTVAKSADRNTKQICFHSIAITYAKVD